MKVNRKEDAFVFFFWSESEMKEGSKFLSSLV
jgi:hypothetical protein